MQTRAVEVTAQSTASPEQIWALLAAVETWSTWGAFDESALERPGDIDPQGVGAIRRFRTGRISNIEEVVRFEPARILSYQVRESDIPMRDYHADVMLAATAEGGTVITWRSSFRARWPAAPLIERRLRGFTTDTAQRLAIAAKNGGRVRVTTARTPRTIELRPIGTVRGARTEATDDDWGDTKATIALDPRSLDLSAVRELEQFSHIEVIYQFHSVLPESVVRGARRPSGNRAWPAVGILAQRAKDRPNRLGVSRCQLLAIDGLDLHVRGLDAIDGTPVLDIKPHMQEFDCRWGGSRCGR
jgi:tRNA-Thr(GGU) m(6)t(6)A37 methyltransferase TsaA